MVGSQDLFVEKEQKETLFTKEGRLSHGFGEAEDEASCKQQRQGQGLINM